MRYFHCLGIIHVLREPAQNENGFFSLGWGVVSKKVVRIFWLFSNGLSATTTTHTQQQHLKNLHVLHNCIKKKVSLNTLLKKN
jgi:hypothetical protein